MYATKKTYFIEFITATNQPKCILRVHTGVHKVKQLHQATEKSENNDYSTYIAGYSDFNFNQIHIFKRLQIT